MGEDVVSYRNRERRKEARTRKRVLRTINDTTLALLKQEKNHYRAFLDSMFSKGRVQFDGGAYIQEPLDYNRKCE